MIYRVAFPGQFALGDLIGQGGYVASPEDPASPVVDALGLKAAGSSNGAARIVNGLAAINPANPVYVRVDAVQLVDPFLSPHEDVFVSFTTATEDQLLITYAAAEEDVFIEDSAGGLIDSPHPPAEGPLVLFWTIWPDGTVSLVINGVVKQDHAAGVNTAFMGPTLDLFLISPLPAVTSRLTGVTIWNDA